MLSLQHAVRNSRPQLVNIFLAKSFPKIMTDVVLCWIVWLRHVSERLLPVVAPLALVPSLPRLRPTPQRLWIVELNVVFDPDALSKSFLSSAAVLENSGKYRLYGRSGFHSIYSGSTRTVCSADFPCRTERGNSMRSQKTQCFLW